MLNNHVETITNCTTMNCQKYIFHLIQIMNEFLRKNTSATQKMKWRTIVQRKLA